MRELLSKSVSHFGPVLVQGCECGEKAKSFPLSSHRSDTDKSETQDFRSSEGAVDLRERPGQSWH